MLSTQTSFELTGNISDFNSLNENYLKRKQYFQELDKLQSEVGEYLMYGFTLQSMETSLEEKFEVNAGELFYGQIVLSIYDVDVGFSFLSQEVKFNNVSEQLEINNRSGLVCIISFIEEASFSRNWISCLLDNDGSTISFHDISLFSAKTTTERLFELFNAESSHDLVRFSIFQNGSAWIEDAALYKEITENLVKSLNSTAVATLRTAYFAYWEMTQQQIVESLEIHSSENSLITNVLLLNKQVYDIQNQLAFIPDYKRIGLTPTTQSIGYKTFSNINTWCNSASINRLQKVQLNYDGADSRARKHMCGNDSTCSLATSFSSASCPNAPTTDIIAMPISTVFGEQVLELEFSYDIISASTNDTLMINIFNQFVAGSPTDECLSVAFANVANFSMRPKLASRPILRTGTLVPYILDSTFSWSFEFSEAITGSLVLQNPTIVSFENAGQLSYGIEFDGNLNITETSFLLRPQVSAYQPVCIRKTGKLCKAPTFTMQKGGAIYGDIRSVGDNVGSIRWERCFNAAIPAIIPYVHATATWARLSTKQENQVFFALAESTVPTVYYSQSLSNVEYQLDSLANEVANLSEKVSSLESAGSSFLSNMLDMVSIFSSALDFAKNIYDKAQYLLKISKTARNTLMKSNKESRALAQLMKDELALLKSPSSMYNPIEAVNQGVVFSYQHGLTKQKWRSTEFAKTSIVDMSAKALLENSLDAREILQTNPALYLQAQSLLGKHAKFPASMNIPQHGFGYVNAHSSPIEVIPVSAKYLHNKAANSEAARSFLSNQYQRFPFHTSVSVRTFDFEKDGKLVYNVRFSGVGEPSIIGPTNLKSPRVKIGYVKLQYDVDSVTGAMNIRNWQNTKIIDDRVYTSDEVRQLYLAFSGRKTTVLDTDRQWKAVALFTNGRIKSRNVVDRMPIPNGIFLESLDDLMFFSKAQNNFKYNLFNNNCQHFVKTFTQLASQGYSSLSLSASDFSEYARVFGANSARYVSAYFRPTLKQVFSYKQELISSFKSAVSMFYASRLCSSLSKYLFNY